jgi:hypothetical protein
MMRTASKNAATGQSADGLTPLSAVQSAGQRRPIAQSGKPGAAIRRYWSLRPALPVLRRRDWQKNGRPQSRGLKEEKNSLDEGEAVLILPESLSADRVRDLEYWLQGILRKAKRRAGIPDDKEAAN